MSTTQERLRRAMKQGSLTVADLSTWFARDYHTVHGWVEKGREPWGPNGQESLRLLSLLESAIKRKRGFPVPLYLSQAARSAYLKARRHDLDGRFSQARSA